MTLPRPEIPGGPPQPLRPLDPSAPAQRPGALFGFDIPLAEATVVVVPVPYEATVSSRPGAAEGPAAVIKASGQVDLLDPLVNEPWKLGLAALPADAAVRALSTAASAQAQRARAEQDPVAFAAVDAAGRRVWDWVEDITGRLLDSGRVPLILGGEHAVSLGAFRAAAERHEGLGLLQFDAHADLREAYEGFTTSHASVMRRALELPRIARLVQVGLRDFCVEETAAQRESGGRASWFTDSSIASRVLEGETFFCVAREIVAALPDVVWVSIDIDGLDPSLCPGTGTPVPGGLTWREATYLLTVLARSGKRIVGADLVECGATFWDGFVGAKTLYLLAGVAGQSRRLLT